MINDVFIIYIVSHTLKVLKRITKLSGYKLSIKCSLELSMLGHPVGLSLALKICGTSGSLYF